jgi:hypothetical protein
MNPSVTPPDRRLLSDQLVQELTAMRDALMQLSLYLRDWQFEVDQPARQLAQQETDALLQPLRNQPPAP